MACTSTFLLIGSVDQNFWELLRVLIGMQSISRLQAYHRQPTLLPNPWSRECYPVSMRYRYNECARRHLEVSVPPTCSSCINPLYHAIPRVSKQVHSSQCEQLPICLNYIRFIAGPSLACIVHHIRLIDVCTEDISPWCGMGFCAPR